MNGQPDSIRARAAELSKTNANIDGWPWPELTPLLMSPGDGVIALHSLPHTPTSDPGPNPRMNVYFRVRRLREGSAHEGTRRLGHGVSDHPDRAILGSISTTPMAMTRGRYPSTSFVIIGANRMICRTSLASAPGVNFY